MSSHFGELDTTPTNRHLQSSRQKVNRHGLSDKFDKDLSGDDTFQLNAMATLPDGTQDVPWSEPASQTHRSSPAVGQTPKDIWDFGNGIDNDSSSLPPLSSPKSGLDNLPDTVPIPPGPSPDTHQPLADTRSRFDLSETASTMRRSSPFGVEAARSTIWDLLGDSPDRGFSDDHCQGPTTESILPTNNAGDTTPTKQSPHHSTAQNVLHLDSLQEIRDSFDSPLVMESPVIDLQGALEQADAQACRRLDFESEKDFVPSPPEATEPPPSHGNGANSFDSPAQSCGTIEASDAHDSPQKSTNSPPVKPQNRGKKRKQRAKPPIQFDENTRVVEKKPQVRRKAPRINVATATLDKEDLLPKPSPAIPAKRAATKNSSQPKKKRKTNAPKQSPKEPATVSAQEKKVPKRAPPRKPKQTALAKQKSPPKEEPASESPAKRHKVSDESVISEINHTVSSPGDQEESPKLTETISLQRSPPSRQVQDSDAKSTPPTPIKNGKNVEGLKGGSKYPVCIPSDTSSSISSGSLYQAVPLGSSSPMSKSPKTKLNPKITGRRATSRLDARDNNSAPNQEELPDSNNVGGSFEGEYEDQKRGSPISNGHRDALQTSRSPPPKVVMERKTRKLPLESRDPNIQAGRNENRAVDGTAAVSLASSKTGRVLRPTSSEAKKEIVKEIESLQHETTSRQPIFMQKIAHNEKSDDESNFQQICRGRQRIKEPEIKRTLSISEDGSPVRLQRSQARELVSPAQIESPGSSDSEDQNQAFVREGCRPSRRKVRRQLVFTNSPPTARSSLSAAPVSTRGVDDTNFWPIGPKKPEPRTKVNGVEKDFRSWPHSFQIAEVKDKIRTQISASFHEQRPAEEVPTHGQGANARKTDTKSAPPSHSYNQDSMISRELHGIVDVSSPFPHFWAVTNVPLADDDQTS